MTYTRLALVGLAGAVLTDTLLLRTWLLRRRIFWTAYGIVLFFQLIVNGVLTGRGIVRYDPATILGPRLAYAPVEDLLFGFALVTVTLAAWVRLGRGAGRRRPAAAPARRPRPGAAGRPPGAG